MEEKNKDTGYQLEPPDFRSVTLTPEMAELIEKTAEKVHESWAASRMAEGWSYGPARDDIKKETPCMVPYEELSESEREVDRNTVKTVICAILKAGYRFEK